MNWFTKDLTIVKLLKSWWWVLQSNIWIDIYVMHTSHLDFYYIEMQICYMLNLQAIFLVSKSET